MKTFATLLKASKGWLFFLGFMMLSFAGSAQTVPCPPNLDFENGDLTNWECWLGVCSTGTTKPLFANAFISGPQPTRHNLQSATSVPAYDAYGNFPVLPAGGGSYALKLGSDSTNYAAERVKYYVHVPVGFNDYSFNFRFAVVLQNGHQSTPSLQPAFTINAYDSANPSTVLPCAIQEYVADATLISVYGFQNSTVGSQVIYLPWTGGAVPIIGQGGKTIVIEVTAYDCAAGGHFGYGYFDVVGCGKYKASVSYCNLDSGYARFIGTGLTQNYNWYDMNWNLVGTGAYVDVRVPNTPTYYIGVKAAGSAGCLDTIYTDTIANFTIDAKPDAACARFGNPIQITTSVTGGIPSGFTYSWDFNADLSDRTISNPIASPRDTTQYIVTVSDKVGCFRKDTVHITQAPDAGPDLKVCPLGERPVQLFVAGPPGASFTWKALDGSPAEYLSCTDCQNPISAPLVPSYTYIVSYAGCDVLDTITVTHDLSNSVVAPQDPLIVCRPDYQNLQSIAIGPGPRQNVPCGTATPISCAPADQQTATIGYSNTIPAAKKNNTPFFTEKAYHKYQFIIPKKDMLYYGIYSGTLNSISFQTLGAAITGNALENITVSLACVPYTEFPTPIDNNSFAAGAIPVAYVSSYTLTANAWNTITFDTPYSWDTTQNLLVDICMGPMTNISAAGTGADGVAMVPGQSIQKYDDLINVCGGNAQNVYSYGQRPVVQFQYCQTDSLPFRYAWIPGSYLNDSTIQNPTAYVAKSINYAVTTIGRNGCLVVDTLHITVPTHHLFVSPAKDSSVCQLQPAYLFASGGDAYEWFEYSEGVFVANPASLSCSNCQNTVATPLQTTTYAVVFSNDQNVSNPNNPNAAIGCPDTLFTTVTVKPLPPVRIFNDDTTITYGHNVQLFARGAANYAWTPVGSLSDPNSPAPIATPTETTNYIVTGLDSNGCAYHDTVKVTVIFNEHILVPTAFTPNGDGRNDIFKVINPTYQRLMEFRVFNRWGQEIFSTTDINNGWDGTWKNVEQPIGNYQYLIRVGSPDGRVEMYKGEVTLVR